MWGGKSIFPKFFFFHTEIKSIVIRSFAPPWLKVYKSICAERASRHDNDNGSHVDCVSQQPVLFDKGHNYYNGIFLCFLVQICYISYEALCYFQLGHILLNHNV